MGTSTVAYVVPSVNDSIVRMFHDCELSVRKTMALSPASFPALLLAQLLPSLSSMPGPAHTGPGPFWPEVFAVATIAGGVVYGIMAALVCAAGWRRGR